MARIKHTKGELKAQRDALRRFERYLPTLQLKKQQLQLEVRSAEAQLDERRRAAAALGEELRARRRLFAEPFDFARHLRLAAVRETEGNIAGVAIPVLAEVVFERTAPDLFATPPWVDDGLRALERTVRLSVETAVLEEQVRRLAEELRTTTQRVNLFEKVKIPETESHIRTIRTFLGDQQTAEVARSKLVKGRSAERDRAA
jgi:V/A-type H+-transporting ATPase subunit D